MAVGIARVALHGTVMCLKTSINLGSVAAVSDLAMPLVPAAAATRSVADRGPAAGASASVAELGRNTGYLVVVRGDGPRADGLRWLAASSYCCAASLFKPRS